MGPLQTDIGFADHAIHRQLCCIFVMYSGCWANCKLNTRISCVKKTTTGQLLPRFPFKSVGYTTQTRSKRSLLMRIFPQEWPEWARTARKCLKIGSFCTLCARPGLPEADICPACECQFRSCLGYTNRLGLTTRLCPGCGVEVLREGADAGGAQCEYRYCKTCYSASRRLLRDIIAPYHYAHPLDQLIKRIKYHEERQLARVVGTLLGNAVIKSNSKPLPHVLVPMPLHASRLKQRGFNQAQDIARWAGRRAGVPVAARLVSRTVDTGSLAGLSRLERQHRILGAFRASDALAGRRVAIVDDVLTTGASARELAREIYDTGAESVDLWVLARTSSRRSGV